MSDVATRLTKEPERDVWEYGGAGTTAPPRGNEVKKQKKGTKHERIARDGGTDRC